MSKARARAIASAIEQVFGEAETVPAIRQSHWRELPLPLTEFVRSPDHLSSESQLDLYPEQRADLEAFLSGCDVPNYVDKRGQLDGDRNLPTWGTDPQLLFDPDTIPKYNQAFIIHGKGSGKDTIISFLQCWIAHILLCLHSPQEYFDLPPGESIDIPVIGYSEAQAKTVYFQKFKTRLKSWPWLKRTIHSITGIDGDRYLRDGGDYVHTYDVLLPHNINCWSLNSSLGTSEGKNVLFWVLDELAAFNSPVKQNLAREIHNLVVSSARSRFKHRWRGCAISFPRHKQDYMMTTAAEVARGIIYDTYVSIKPTWVVRPDRTREDFAADFARDPEDAATKYGCDPPAAYDAYFRSPELLLLHASGAPLELLRSKLDLPEERLRAIASLGQNPIVEVDRAGDPVLDRRGFPKVARWVRGQTDLSGNPYEYFLHLDPGLSGDSFGLALGHNHQLDNGLLQPTIDLAFRWSGRQFKDFGEIYRQSWGDGFHEETEVVTAAEVDFRTVREFVFFLRYARGFTIEMITTDTWNSAESKQELLKRGFPVGNRIVTKEDYDEFKTLVYNRMLRYYAAPVLIEEAYKLQLLNGTKVDAPRTSEGEGTGQDSHKDVTDAVAAVCRRLAHLRGDGIDFAQLPSAEEIWERTEKPSQIELGGFVHDQQQALGRFFD